ncbi:MAG: DEAD/DEAH box helicase [Crocinitomix sp.]|nr:DEAD/DEAH box helicase [Crocinitomix sp.]
MRFSEYRISRELKSNLEEMGFKRPTDIQFKCIPNIQKGEDLLAIAQTGTGKTAAFAIPIIDKIQFNRKTPGKDGIKCIVMVPTRELCTQIADVFNQIARRTKVKTMAVYGGVEQDSQIERLVAGVDILVTTPGRMFDLVSQGFIKLDKIETLILDEADQMLNLGFYKDIEDLIRFLPKRRQTLFFSATIDQKIKKLAYSLVNSKAIRIQISPKDPVSKNVTHAITFVEMDDKRFFLERILKEKEELKFMVFVRTKVRAERVKSAMERVGIETDAIHGDKDQKDRQKVLNDFKTNETRILIATDVSARGIDIPNVDYVINYDMPDVAENYVHRVGRTGRGKNKGQALSFCSEGERELLKGIEDYITVPIDVLETNKKEVAETIMFSDDGTNNWKALIQKDEADKKKKRKGSGKGKKNR